ncbi:adhesin [Methanobrevibacter sp. OttesenSCG-928-K11]|nr:adhesin [Methanobrevibacter sp. OttesenSCG-928-K11]
MNLNKITIILSIFIVLLSIGSVSAADNFTGSTQETDIVDEINYQNMASTSNLNVETNDNQNQVNNVSVLNNTQIIIEDGEMYYKNGTRLVVNLLDEDGIGIVGENITITINGKVYDRTTGENGTASMGVNLDPGVYEYTVTYKGSAIYNSSVANATWTVLSTIDSEGIVKFYKNGTHYYATYLDKQGKPISGLNVTFNINGKFYPRTTNGNGTAMLSINLDPGEYILTTINPNDGLSRGYNITVLSSIDSEGITKYYKNDTQYYATFYDSEGNPLNNTNVTFNINGVIYTRLTNQNGTAMLSINLDPGKYILTAKNTNDGLLRSYNVTVLSNLIVKDQTFNYNLTENGIHGKYSVKLVDDQGNNVSNATITLNINGLFYKVTTDNNGTAYLNIRLNPGTYVITATYGDLSVSSKVIVNKINVAMSVLTPTINSGERYKVKVTIKDTSRVIAGVAVYFQLADDTTWYRVSTNSEGIASILIHASPGTYQIISAIQDEAFYVNVASYNQVKIN